MFDKPVTSGLAGNTLMQLRWQASEVAARDDDFLGFCAGIVVGRGEAASALPLGGLYAAIIINKK